MILSDQSLQALGYSNAVHYGVPIHLGNSFSTLKGVSCEGSYSLKKGDYILAVTKERFVIPRNCLGICLNRSSLARKGVLLNTTPLEPEWEGYITLEIANLGCLDLVLTAGDEIGQVIIFKGDTVCQFSYADKKGVYQDQVNKPVMSIDH